MISKTLQNNEQLFQRLFEIVPGLFIWILLFSPLWAGKAFPFLVADILVILAIYWFYRGVLTTIGVSIGYFKYRRAIAKDWLAECNKLAEYELPDPDLLPTQQFLPKHLIMYPVGAAKYDVLKTTLEGIRSQNYPKELIYIAISLEERLVVRDPDYFADMKQKIFTDFSEYGDRIMIFEHPDGIVGEAIGAAANRTWGAKNAVAQLEQRGEVISDFLITSPDEDLIFHPQFLAAATYKYLVNDKRNRKFYQTALYTFNNNYWDVPMLMRVLSVSLTLPVLSSSVIEKHKRETYSCYTINLQVLKDVNYWDTRIGIDDTTFYWRPFFYFDGDWSCEVFFVPLSADAVYDPDYINNHKEQYKQYLRWGWGVISFPIGMKVLLTNNRIPLLTRIAKIIHLFEMFVFFKVLAFLLTFSIPILLLLNPQLGETVFWYTVPNTISAIMSITVIFMIPATLYKILIVPPRPKLMPKYKYILRTIVEVPLNLVVLLTYSFLPFVEASTRMMLGQPSARTVTWSVKQRK